MVFSFRHAPLFNEGTKVHNPRRYNTSVMCLYVAHVLYTVIYIIRRLMREYTGKYMEVWQRQTQSSSSLLPTLRVISGSA